MQGITAPYVYTLVGIHGAALETTTSERIISAASKLFYGEGIRGASMDAVAEKAGVTKRTLYYHFKSKDDLVTAYLHGRDQPNLALFERWFADTEGELAEKIYGMFVQLAKSARHPKWKGCGFLRTTAELANMPGHPAMKVGAAHKKKFESWMRELFESEEIEGALLLARQIMLLMDGSFAVVLLHRDPSYMETAGDAAYSLIKAALAARKIRQARTR
jgi:AcrR family transcriptional regulator